MSTTSETQIRELDRRSNDGIDVTLFWESQTDRLFIALEDHRSGGSLEIDVEPSEALEAFQHPYAYAGRAWDEEALVA
jgi:hypothetical protein